MKRKIAIKEYEAAQIRDMNQIHQLTARLKEQESELRKVKRLLLAARDLGHVIDNLLSEDAGQGRYS